MGSTRLRDGFVVDRCKQGRAQRGLHQHTTPRPIAHITAGACEAEEERGGASAAPAAPTPPRAVGAEGATPAAEGAYATSATAVQEELTVPAGKTPLARHEAQPATGMDTVTKL